MPFHLCTLALFYHCTLTPLCPFTFEPLDYFTIVPFHPFILVPLFPFTIVAFHPCTLMPFRHHVLVLFQHCILSPLCPAFAPFLAFTSKQREWRVEVSPPTLTWWVQKHKKTEYKVQTSSITVCSIEVSPPAPSRTTTPSAFTEWQMWFVGPHHLSKILEQKVKTNH